MMTKYSMFLRILRKSILNRKSRMVVALLAITMGATVAAAMLSLTFDINSKMNKELRVYGANLAITSSSESNQFISKVDFEKIQNTIPQNSIIGIQPSLYVVGKYKDTQFALAGIDYSQIAKVTPYWVIDGYKISEITVPQETNSAFIGSRLAKELKLKRGANETIVLEMDSGNLEQKITIAGILSTGGPEENQIFLPLSTVQEITHHPDQISVIQASILGNRDFIGDISNKINTLVPSAHASPILKIAKAEGIVIQKIHVFMFLVSLTILIIAALTVMTTMTALVVERQNEIALVKAIGAADNDVLQLFFCELLVLGFVGGGIGFLAGYGLAQFLGKGLFHTFINLRLIVIPITLTISCAMTIVAGLWAARRVLYIEPAVVLRGE